LDALTAGQTSDTNLFRHFKGALRLEGLRIASKRIELDEDEYENLMISETCPTFISKLEIREL
jgi:hypothetical protein